MRIIAINKKTKTEEEITDLYWFEEEFVHDLKNDLNYDFKFILEDGDNIEVEGDNKIIAGIERPYAHDMEFISDMKIAEEKYKECENDLGGIGEDEATAFIAIIIKSKYFITERYKQWREDLHKLSIKQRSEKDI